MVTKESSRITVITTDLETRNAFLRLTGRAFETGMLELFNAAQGLIHPESVEQYCTRLVRDQISHKAAKKMFPSV